VSHGPIKDFAPPAGLTTPPLSFATRVGELLFVSGIPGFDADAKFRMVLRRSSGLWFAT
jgi:enamine deaminase RidA (YjgF/YER057c/UK114 family)